jgi:methionyl aminopeptidase
MSIEIYSPREIEALRVVSRMAAETLILAGAKLRAGMTTEDINTIVHEDTLRRGATPAPLNYHGFPGPHVLQKGDIVNIDVTHIYNGWFGDTSATFFVGEVSPEAKKVTEVARKALEIGIAQVRENARLGDIGAAIQEYVEGEGCSVVRDFVGHGIGRKFHQAPNVAHYGKRGTGIRLKAGMVFTIEPMVNAGDYRVDVQSDKWTVLTRDRSLSAQFEHQLVVTRDGCEVLTARPEPLIHSEVSATGESLLPS